MLAKVYSYPTPLHCSTSPLSHRLDSSSSSWSCYLEPDYSKDTHPNCTVPKHPLLPSRTSQILHVPSPLTDANSASLVGFQHTRSIGPVWPRSSVLFFTVGLSGFQIRSVRSVLPVAIRWPVGDHAIVRILSEFLKTEWVGVGVNYLRMRTSR